jgi:hypothetical protein
VFALQFGHLIEHVAKAVTGAGLLGTSFDSEFSHFVFNGLIAAAAVWLLLMYPRNPWTYPLAMLTVLHGFEHVYIFREFLANGVSNGPGVFAQGGLIGVIPLIREDLHNTYNGLEAILIVLGLGHEVEANFSDHPRPIRFRSPANSDMGGAR